ncbi:hypothetical protein V3C99_013868 [Haemonchus contortus]|uniref:Uncharacterized protein n=1 Tax=Haemonchus contortus TaxID=6289 RepID=A0A7I4YTK6_HAECO|nr:unnamed protein product [Haemonchus contortus]
MERYPTPILKLTSAERTKNTRNEFFTQEHVQTTGTVATKHPRQSHCSVTQIRYIGIEYQTLSASAKTLFDFVSRLC